MIFTPLQTPSYSQGFARCRGQAAQPQFWDGLVGLWAPFLGPTGPTLFDWSGYGNRGSLTNMDPATDWTAGRYGWALDFDGVNDEVNCGNHSSLHTAALTVEVLCFRRASGDAVFSKGAGRGSPLNRDWSVYNTSGTAGYFVVSNGSSYVVNQSFTWPAANEWHHIVATWDGTTNAGGARVYVDGRLSNSGTASGTNPSNDYDVYVGGGMAYRFDGLIAKAAIYNGSKSAREIAGLNADPFALLRPRRRVLGMLPAIGGPYRMIVGQIFHGGRTEGEVFRTGTMIGQCDGHSG